MLNHPSLDKLRAMKLYGMAKAFQEQLELRHSQELSFEERLGLLIDRELTERDNRRYTSQLKKAQLRHQAALEDLDYRPSRGLDKSLIRNLASGQWLHDQRHLVLTGATGTGKTFLACALAEQAIRQGYTARYFRSGRLLQELTLAKGDGRYLTRLQQLAKINLLILDDWGLEPLTEQDARLLLEVIDDRSGGSATMRVIFSDSHEEVCL